MNNITFTPGEVSGYYGVRAPHLKQERGVEWRGWCIVHKGKNANFAVDPATGRWFCHSACGHGGDIIDLEMVLTGADFKTAKAEVFRLVGRIEPERRHTGVRGSSKSITTIGGCPNVLSRPQSISVSLCYDPTGSTDGSVDRSRIPARCRGRTFNYVLCTVREPAPCRS
jgi:hypothetical protein